jgi:hypothetical protein
MDQFLGILIWRVPTRVAAIAALSLSGLLVGTVAGRSENAVETILFIRHGEKPEGGLGQLTCQGLNRALALPPAIAKSFGRPDAIFAPNPSHPKMDDGQPYDYVRPLATVEPTAIWFGVPVDVSLDIYDTAGLQAAIEERRAPDRNVLILVAWEHKQIAPIVRALLTAHGADPEMVQKVEDWERKDFDSIYVVRIGIFENVAKVTFDHEHEGLDGQPDACPH